MIQLTQLNNVKFVVNCAHIEAIQTIPESKVVLQNKTFFIVKETPEEIVEKVIAFYSSIQGYAKEIAMRPIMDKMEEDS
ncbi:MAG: flagellar FlbD family protein [Bacillota bacterium]